MSPPTSRSTTNTNKRKADALGESYPADGAVGRPAVIARLKDATSVSDTSSTTTTPHIPPPVWGRVLDFMPYEEVRSALLVGKIIANEAVKYVRTLNFTKSCQMDGPLARRFANVEEVNCWCLFSGQSGSAVLCRDTIFRLVPLLVSFAKLKCIDVGGTVTIAQRGEVFRRSYRPNVCSSPRNHGELAKSLCYSFFAAFKARLIPLDLHIEGGVVDNFVEALGLCSRRGEARDDTNSEGMCATCRDVCSYFPLQEIFHESPWFCECAERMDVFEKISKRKGARELFRKESFHYLPHFVDRHLEEFSIEEETLRLRLAGLGMSCGDEDKGVWYLTMSKINELDRLIAVGFDPKAILKERLYDGMNIGRDGRQFDVFAKSTFDALVARGFALDEADLIVLDERMEPALKDLPALIRGESDNT